MWIQVEITCIIGSFTEWNKFIEDSCLIIIVELNFPNRLEI
jgi:hypothetical protein